MTITTRTVRYAVLGIAGVVAVAFWIRANNHPEGVRVTAADFGDKWPLSIPVAYISCSGPYVTVVRTPEGKAYALTGIAETAMKLPKMFPIWKPDPRGIEGLYISRSPLVDAALKLCK